MKHLVYAALFAVLFMASGCGKNDTEDEPCPSTPTTVAPAGEIAAVQTYLTNSGVTTATQHSSGMFYQITTAGTGTVTPQQCSGVSVTYVGRLTNGSTFDQATTPVSFVLSNLITGWRIGIPLIKTGGTIRLYVPPSLGYGSQAVGSIPANSILVFDITLFNVQ